MSGRLLKVDLPALAIVVCLDMLQDRWKNVSTKVETWIAMLLEALRAAASSPKL